ncbi:carbamoyltransferase HypF [Vibrio sp. HA2012]|uniref:carbamoyltransferase HypF n=1 Tax=Vibrio sp. HA2012 TaxID=1971595 RepID=UPI000C2BDD36|nr:carbamoyltransferase HypF [Vibrio sp. HA2012]PJC87730.1 carbamoyltransferase HypF [Vibrio sp. HA2012]
MQMKGTEIRVRGKVQGVGFRPFIWQLTQEFHLKGEVFNDGEGVIIRLTTKTTGGQIERFRQALLTRLPPLACVDSLTMAEYKWTDWPDNFRITASATTAINTQIVPDAATCPACLAELHDRTNRRYRYPFINCTHCGPRFTIIQAMPYDRSNTVMRHFPLCPACDSEYRNPANRRYHAQPTACTECGPNVWITNREGTQLPGHWLTHAVNALKQGQIIAIKSVGGFHLVCNACDNNAVATLRQRKQRRHKPFAIMAANINAVRDLACCSQLQQKILTSGMAPILLLKKKAPTSLADNIAPGLAEIGIMLPSNPLQHLLARAFPYPLVMTSGNASGYPPAIENKAALVTLGHLTDRFILHNRPIIQRCDDSLLRVDNQHTEVLRRSRGMVPDALDLPEGFPDADGYLAYGGDLKSAFAIGKGRKIIVSQYLGDLSNVNIQQQYQQTIRHYTSLYQLNIQHHVADLHPGYFSHQLAEKQAASSSEITFVQHHHAHIAACLIENNRQPGNRPVLALALDGLGLGDDHTFWGGELCIADYQNMRRIGGIPAIRLSGGDRAAREPWRAYYAHLRTFLPQLTKQELAALLPRKPIQQLNTVWTKNINTHTIRSAGRLFDAVAASLNIITDTDPLEYEGQAACHLEAIARQHHSGTDPQLTIPLNELTLDLRRFWGSWLKLTGSTAEKAWLFHHALADALASMVLKAQSQYALNELVLTGGVFHNALLSSLLREKLSRKIHLLEHKDYSCGDGGLALGQIAIALLHNGKN